MICAVRVIENRPNSFKELGEKLTVRGVSNMKDEKIFRSLKQIRDEYFPKAVEREKLKDESPAETAARIMKDIFTEMRKE